MSETISDQCPADPDSLSVSPTYLFRMGLLAVAIMALHAAQFFFIGEDISSIRKAALPKNRNIYFSSNDDVVLPGNSVVWNNEVWASACSGSGIVYSPIVSRPSSRLVTIDMESGQRHDTDLKFSPAPIGMIVFDDQLWFVGEGAVYQLVDNNLVQRNPRRHLNHPSKPFLYEGKIAVVDKNANDVYSLLTYDDGEWTMIGLIEVPAFSAASPWQRSELRVLPVGDTYYLFFFDASSLRFREGFGALIDPSNAPVSALEVENDRTTRELAKIGNAQPNPYRNSRNLNNANNLNKSGWQNTSIGISWNQTWDVGDVGGTPTVFSVIGGSPKIQKHIYRKGTWVPVSTTIPVSSATISYVTGSSSLLIHEDLRLISSDTSMKSNLTPEVILLSEKIRFVISMLALSVRYSLLAALLGTGTWWLMRKYRSPDYLYGKRHAVHASVLRRGIARGIDTMITAYPPLFWFAHAMQSESENPWRFTPNPDINLFLISLFSIFATWIAGIVVLSVMQGFWGVTPGKWLCGIRTFRTTLRPCGPLRGFAREMLIYIDGLFLAIWLPGVVSIAFTKNWQRLGDLAADTIVVVNPNRQSWLS